MNIGEKIRKLRKERHLSQTELAITLNATQDTISLWELGKSLPNILDLAKLAKLFDVSSDHLIGLSDL